MRAITRGLIRLRDEHPSLGRPRFFQGEKVRGSKVEDLAWFRPDGQPMSDEDWEAGWNKSIAMRLGGKALEDTVGVTGPIGAHDQLPVERDIVCRERGGIGFEGRRDPRDPARGREPAAPGRARRGCR